MHPQQILNISCQYTYVKYNINYPLYANLSVYNVIQ